MREADILDSFRQEYDRINAIWNMQSQWTHIIIASTLISLLTYGMFNTSELGVPHSLLISFVILVPSIMLHELMHVQSAKELGFSNARYVAYLPMLVASCLIVLFFRVPFILLIGFAQIEGRLISYPLEWYYSKLPFLKLRIRNYREATAFIAMAGVLTNLVLTVLAMLSLLLLRHGFLSSLIATIMQINFMLLAFNMLPLPIFDGNKIFNGNRNWFFLIWGAILSLIILTSVLISSLGVRLLI